MFRCGLFKLGIPDIVLRSLEERFGDQRQLNNMSAQRLEKDYLVDRWVTIVEKASVVLTMVSFISSTAYMGHKM